ncbi:MAG TPA: VWA domain-containing protein [Polyangiaceae bacterium]|nr:VWA domain-containing protein [Polyangiaceae bacterium]HPK96065.1 VWA domain-containing protein [Polyangiaceae bacterium]HQF24976.1 VWA domain-containing protein [Polyangiaceae bacterium]HQM12501.1 VWA domain-containing protein [Polyangiaceae bacterium]
MAPSPKPQVSFTLQALYRTLDPKPQKLLVMARASAAATIQDDAEPSSSVQLAVAVDISGSMEGVKLRAAVSTLHALIDELGPNDSLGLIGFSNSSKVWLPSTPMTSAAKQIAHACLDRAKADGGTDLAGAILSALRVIEASSERRKHVIVLTDGQPTAGVCDPDRIVDLVKKAKKDVTASFFGYGEDVNPDLLERLAQVGSGRFHFVPGTEPPVEAFAAELGQQRDLLGIDASISLTTGKGVKLCYLPSLAEVRKKKTGIRISIPNLLAGDARSVVFEIEVNEDAFALSETTPWVEATLRYRSVLDAQEYVNDTHLVPVIAAEKSEPVVDVAREFSVQRLAELVGAVTRWDNKNEQEKASLMDFVQRMGLQSDPQIMAGFDMLDRLQHDLADASKRRWTHLASSAASKGMYERSVTGMGVAHVYSKPRAESILRRMFQMVKDDDKDPEDAN